MADEFLEEWNARQRKAAHAAFLEANPDYPRFVRTIMPNVNQMLQSKYLSKADLATPLIMSVRGVGMEPKGRDNTEPAWLMWFNEHRKPMKLNNTVIRYLGETLGPESDRWIGKRVRVYIDHSVMMAGQMVGGVRIQVSQRDIQAMAAITQQMYAGAGGQPSPQGGPVFAGNTPSQPTAGPGAPIYGGQTPAGQAGQYGSLAGQLSSTQPPHDPSTGEVHRGGAVDEWQTGGAPGAGDFDDDIPF